MKTLVTKTETRKVSRKASKAKRDKASVKRSGKARKASKATKARKGGGKALSDFGNSAKLRVLNAKEIPSRRACFKTGQTVAANLTAQKKAGFRGRRKFIRAQIAQNRVSVS